MSAKKFMGVRLSVHLEPEGFILKPKSCSTYFNLERDSAFRRFGLNLSAPAYIRGQA